MSDTTTGAVGSTSFYSYEDYLSESRAPKQELGESDFLQLLAAQLQYQDPLEPTQDTDFIAQMAQFSSLQSMETLNATMTATQAYELAGKYVYAEMSVGGQTYPVVGLVSSVFVLDGVPYAVIQTGEGELSVPTSDISEVFSGDVFNPENPLLTHAPLIGRTVQASIPSLDADGEPILDENEQPVYETVSGVVTGVNVDAGVINATLQLEDGTETVVTVNSIFDIQQ